jgi:biopolymer transport protein ExbD
MSLLRRPDGKSRVKLTEMNMTPLIDCVFQLLLFFMVGMKFRDLDRQLQANLPKGGSGYIGPELLVDIRNVGTAASPAPRILIDRRPMRDWDAAEVYLRTYARTPEGKDTQVILAVSDDAAHGWAVRALGILNHLGYRNISIKR